MIEPIAKVIAINEIKLISGTANPELARRISEHISVPLTPISLKKFTDGEIYVQVNESVRGLDCFVIQPTCSPVNDNVMELLLILDALKRASANSITVIMPYFGYARQDRKAEPREAISAKLMADIITRAGATRVLTIDLHAPAIQGFFDIPVDDLWAVSIFSKYIRERHGNNFVVVAPDTGGAKRARVLAKLLDCPMALIDKRRTSHNEVEVLNVIGDVSGRNALIIDDIIDTAGTISNAVSALKRKGALKVMIAASHALLSGPAVERLSACGAEEVIVTDTVPIPKEKRFSGLTILSFAPLLAEAIRNISENRSVSGLTPAFFKESDDSVDVKKGLKRI